MKMEDNTEYRNFVACYRGLSFVGRKLKLYTEDGLNSVYQCINKKLDGTSPCTEQCSKNYGRDISRWCNTCNLWKEELHKFCKKGKYIPWQDMKSWNWPFGKESIAEIFLPSSWKDKECKLNDIGTVCSIWRKCKVFKINRNICDRLSTLRNYHYGHNPELKVSELDRAKVFDVLKDLIKDPAVKSHVELHADVAALCKIENDNNDIYMDLLKSIHVDLDHSTRKVLDKIDDLEQKVGKGNQANKRLSNRSQTGLNIIILLLIVICCFYIKHYMISVFIPFISDGSYWTTRQVETDCVSEEYKYPFPQDLPLIQYVTEHKGLIGREWLFEEIELLLDNITQDTGQTGILLAAEPGYGKTALISHMLCATENAKGWTLRQKIVAFHVCKFDVQSTMKAGRFLRRLIGFFSTYSAQFGSEISLLDKDALIYNDERCESDPVACLDQGVLFPLSKIKADKNYIIVIDALDECYDKDTNENNIKRLLKKRLINFPNWITFLISTRNLADKEDLKRINVLHLRSSDKRNLRDIEAYLDTQETVIDRIQGFLGKKSKAEMVKELLKESEGNFLFITYSLEYILNRKLGQKDNLPLRLADFYESNFERQFPKTSDFLLARSILQVVCAALNPLSKDEIKRVLYVNNFTDDLRIDETFMKLSSILRTHIEVTFIHKSVHDWLLSKDNERFQIHQEQGHVYISNHLMGMPTTSHSLDFIELVTHVGKSNSASLVKIFKSLKHANIKIDSDPIHKLINLTSSVTALKLILPYFREIDSLDENKVTAAFIASSKGHLQQLKLLVKKGSDYNFILNHESSAFLIGNIHTVFWELKQIKSRRNYGFSLLHIAVANNHLDVVRYLLRLDNSLIYIRNGLGHLASDMACEYGFIDILKEIAFFNNSVVGEMCYYLAARNGNVFIIDFVISINRSCTCISDSDSLNSYKKVFISHSEVNIASYGDREYLTVYPLDVWWMIFKESALHVAVRKGHSLVVDRLVQSFRYMLDCKDLFGRTPFLASIWYNQTDIFESLSYRLNEPGEVCSNVLQIHLVRSVYLKDVFKKNDCKNGYSVAHLFAKFDRWLMMKTVIAKSLPINWSLLDEDGYPPEHTAACSTSHHYLAVIRIKQVYTLDRKYKDNMTVYHSAAMCGQYTILQSLQTEIDKTPIPQYVDDLGRGVLLYAALKPVYHKSSELQQDHLNVVAYLLLEAVHSFSQVDLKRRNILHYALVNGYASLSYWLAKTETMKTLINQRDSTGKTPVDLSISENMEISESFKLNNGCRFYMMFHTECPSLDKSEVMPLWEQAVSHVLRCGYENGYKYFIPIDLLTLVLKNRPYLATASLLFSNNTERDFTRVVKRVLRFASDDNPNFKYSLFSLAVHKPNSLVVCYQPFRISPLHRFIYSLGMELSDHYNNSFIQKMLSSITKKFGCPDDRGFNILHYALLGGDIPTAELLMNSGVPITNNRVHYEDILWMVVLSPLKGSRYTSCSVTKEYIAYNSRLVDYRPLYCVDTFLSNFISSHISDFDQYTFCSNKTVTFSLVHLLAFNGMLKTLQIIAANYGFGLLTCANRDDFTTQYMWRLVHEEKYFNENFPTQSKLHLPNKTAEEQFLYMIFISHPLSNVPFKCLLNIKSIHWKIRDSRKRYMIKRCLDNSFSVAWLSSGYTINERCNSELCLMSLFNNFLENLIHFQLLIERNSLSNCSSMIDFLQTRVNFESFCMQYSKRFYYKKRLCLNISRRLSSFKIVDMCPLSEHSMRRLVLIHDAMNTFVFQVLPVFTNMHSRYLFAVNRLHSVSDLNEFSNFLDERAQIYRPQYLDVLKPIHQQTEFDIAASYDDVHHFDIIKKSSMYRIKRLHIANI